MQHQPEHLATHLLQIALDRSKALSEELQRLRSRQYPPTGPKVLIELAIRTNQQINDDLSNMLASQATIAAIPSRDFENTLRNKTSLLAYLHLLMQYVEGAEIQHAPIALIFSLRRLLRKHLDNFDFIVRTTRSYNYRLWSLTEGIQHVFTKAGYASLLHSFPSQFFVIDCPVSERRNVPVHCIFGHELSHALYQRYDLASSLSLYVSLDESQVQRLIATHAMQPVEVGEGRAEATAGEVVPRWVIEHAVRNRLQTIVAQWVEELAADALALCISGPAYFFAFVYFAGPFALMDSPSGTHPPDRMRIELMCHMLLNTRQGLAYGKVLDENANSYIKQWQSYAMQAPSTPPSGELTFYDIATQAITPIFKEIIRQTKAVTRGKRYTAKSFQRDVLTLCDNLARGFPLNEIIDDWTTGQPRIIEAESMLNAGWAYLISGDDRYARLLGVEDSWVVTNRLFDLVSKSLEYAEIQRQWEDKA